MAYSVDKVIHQNNLWSGNLIFCNKEMTTKSYHRLLSHFALQAFMKRRAQKKWRYFFLWQTNIQRKLATTLKTKTSTKEHVNALSSTDESWHSHRPPPHVHHHQWVRENIDQFSSLRGSRLDRQAYVEMKKEWGNTRNAVHHQRSIIILACQGTGKDTSSLAKPIHRLRTTSHE